MQSFTKAVVDWRGSASFVARFYARSGSPTCEIVLRAPRARRQMCVDATVRTSGYTHTRGAHRSPRHSRIYVQPQASRPECTHDVCQCRCQPQAHTKCKSKTQEAARRALRLTSETAPRTPTTRAMTQPPSCTHTHTRGAPLPAPLLHAQPQASRPECTRLFVCQCRCQPHAMRAALIPASHPQRSSQAQT